MIMDSNEPLHNNLTYMPICQYDQANIVTIGQVGQIVDHLPTGIVQKVAEDGKLWSN